MDILTTRKQFVEEKLQALSNQGINIWDRNYKKIENGSWPKFDVSWRQGITSALQSHIDSWENVDGIMYCLPMTDDGYISVNRTSISKAPIGDMNVDRAKSRHMYFAVTNQEELRLVNSVKDFSMSTFLLPDGQVVFSVYVAMIINGKRWGTLNSGLLPAAFGLKNS
jgi:methyl-accepting chemotaxis protein